MRPTVIYAGNRELQQSAEEIIREQAGANLLIADNVRPSLYDERLASAQEQLAGIYHRQKAKRTSGFASVGGWTDDGFLPTAHGFSRTVQVLGKIFNEDILGVDLGSSSMTVAATLHGEHYLNVYGDVGTGTALKNVLERIRPAHIARWLTFEPEPDEILNYLYNNAVYYHRVPASTREVEIEYALARELLRDAIKRSRQGWRDVAPVGPLPDFETILLSGSSLATPPDLGWTAITVLDALLPAKRTRVLLDPYGLAPALGSLAGENPVAVIQVLETGSFLELGTFLSVAGRAGRGRVAHGNFSAGRYTESFDAQAGQVTAVPLPYGIDATLNFKGKSTSLDTGRRGRKITVRGGELGLIIDGRGRPLRIPRKDDARQELMASWWQSLVQE